MRSTDSLGAVFPEVTIRPPLSERSLGSILARRFLQEVIEDGAGKSRDELFPSSAGRFLLREKPIKETRFARRVFRFF
jgi:hypothetical protein